MDKIRLRKKKNTTGLLKLVGMYCIIKVNE